MGVLWVLSRILAVGYHPLVYYGCFVGVIAHFSSRLSCWCIVGVLSCYRVQLSCIIGFNYRVQLTVSMWVRLGACGVRLGWVRLGWS